MSTTKERILAAAITCFRRDGFDVGLREIGAEAGFSAALVVRHFGSKDGLRQACDEHVAALILEAKLDSVGDVDMRSVLHQLANAEEYAEILTYVVRSLVAGGELARHLVEQMVADAVNYFAEGVRTGIIKPSRDPVARARYLTYASLGGLLMQLQIEHPGTSDITPVFQEIMDRQLLPAVEIFTHGLFADSRVADAVAATGYGQPEAADDPPNAPDAPAPPSPSPSPSASASPPGHVGTPSTPPHPTPQPAPKGEPQ